jgi:chromosome partitioning protein
MRSADSPMSTVIAFISQKGGVGKSTLARGLATFAARSKLQTKVADLDEQQKTVLVWEKARARHGLNPVLDIASFTSVKGAVASAKGSHVVVLDLAGKITDGASEASEYAHLLVQPTSPSADDLHISVLVFLAMERIGVPREKLAFALCRVLSAHEERDARSYLESFGYAVLESAIPEDLKYRDAMRAGRSITETGHKALDAAADEMMSDILRMAEANFGKKLRSGRGRS